MNVADDKRVHAELRSSPQSLTGIVTKDCGVSRVALKIRQAYSLALTMARLLGDYILLTVRYSQTHPCQDVCDVRLIFQPWSPRACRGSSEFVLTSTSTILTGADLVHYYKVDQFQNRHSFSNFEVWLSVIFLSSYATFAKGKRVLCLIIAIQIQRGSP